MMNWKTIGSGRDPVEALFCMCLDGLRQTLKGPSERSGCPSQDLDWVHPKF